MGKKEWTIFIIIILVVVALGSIIINQMVSAIYKIHMLQSACEICESYGNMCQKYIELNLSDLKNISFVN